MLEKYVLEIKENPIVLYLVEFLMMKNPSPLENKVKLNFNSKKYFNFLNSLDGPSSNLKLYCLKSYISSDALSVDEIVNFFPTNTILKYFIDYTPLYYYSSFSGNQRGKVIKSSYLYSN